MQRHANPHVPEAGSARRRPRLWKPVLWIVAGALLATAALVDITISAPRVAVRWRTDIDAAQRERLERRYDLRNGEQDASGQSTSTWRYDLGDRSSGNIRALVDDPAVDDTGNIDRDALTAPGRAVRVTMRAIPRPIREGLESAPGLLRFHRSAWLLLAGGVLLWAARVSAERRRRDITLATLLVVGVLTLALPFDPAFVKMGESADRGEPQEFEQYFGGRVRFEKHLSQVILLQRYLQLGPAETAAEQALIDVGRGAAVWFVLSALAVGFVERWSPVVLRYLGLALIAPSALLNFGWREFAYLSLNVLTFPLLVRGLRDGGRRIEAASAVAGFGTALHGSGLVSLAGVWMATAAASGRVKERAARLLRAMSFGTAAYVGWVAIYVIVLHLPIQPGGGRNWRPVFADDVVERRISPALVSAIGARDLGVEAWIAGVPLLFAAASLRRRHPHEMRVALWYLPSSILFLVFLWPFSGVGPGIDLVVAGFPAFHALAWICAHDARRTTWAAVILTSAHLVFWWVLLDDAFRATVVG